MEKSEADGKTLGADPGTSTSVHDLSYTNVTQPPSASNVTYLEPHAWTLLLDSA